MSKLFYLIGAPEVLTQETPHSKLYEGVSNLKQGINVITSIIVINK